tara:strand:+ start:584 stop:847 length:264 start_codon:yes stop_codon:yes gene_type:complete
MSNERIDLTWFERFPQHDEQDCAIITDDTYALIWEVPKLIAELKRCYRIIDILQDSEDFDTQVAFHEEGLCKYLKYPCGPCESSEEE